MRTYVGETNSGTPFTYIPLDNIDSSLTGNTDAADDVSDVGTALPTLAKTRDTAVTSDAGNPNDKATIGEVISFDLDLDLPGGATYYDAALTDVLPSGLDLDTGSVTATLDGGALPVGFTLTADDPGNSITISFPATYSIPNGPDEELLVAFDATVLDAGANIRSAVRTNTAHFDFDNASGDARNVEASVDTTIVEPNLIVAKSHDDGNGIVDAGQVVTYLSLIHI